MMKKAVVPLLIFAGLVILIFGILMLDLRLSHNQFTAENQISTFASNLEKGMAVSPNLGLVFSVSAPQNPALEEDLKKELEESLENMGSFGQVEVLESIPGEVMEQGIFLLQVEDIDIDYSPIYAKAALVVSTIFASDGDVSWREAEPVVIDTRLPAIRHKGSFSMTALSQGFISRPGFYNYLAEEIAREMVKGLQTSLDQQK